MKKENNIAYIRKLIGYFKSKEINHTIEEEDRIWNNIMSEITSSKRKRRYELKQWQISFVSISAAAMIAGVAWFLNLKDEDESTNLYTVYQSMSSNTYLGNDNICILADDSEIASVENSVTIDYSKSEKEVVLDEKVIDKPQNTKYHQLIVPNGKHTSLILADGSKLFVNAGTRVVYPDKFKKDCREIFVDGEIFIDVAKNDKQPFTVRTSSCDVQVLGTSFNVLAYSTDLNAEVVLLRGSVKLKDKNENELMLNPDELAVVSEDNIKGKHKVNASDYVAWTKGLLKLDATPLSSVFKRLERYYGVAISFSDEVGTLKMYGNLDLECPIEEVLRRIKYTAPIYYNNIDNKFEIKMNENR